MHLLCRQSTPNIHPEAQDNTFIKAAEHRNRSRHTVHRTQQAAAGIFPNPSNLLCRPSHLDSALAHLPLLHLPLVTLLKLCERLGPCCSRTRLDVNHCTAWHSRTQHGAAAQHTAARCQLSPMVASIIAVPTDIPPTDSQSKGWHSSQLTLQTGYLYTAHCLSGLSNNSNNTAQSQGTHHTPLMSHSHPVPPPLLLTRSASSRSALF